VSYNTAFAARVGTHRVTYEPSFGVPNPSGFQFRIDGKLLTAQQEKALGTTKGIDIDGGGSITQSSDDIEVNFPDGKIMSIVPSTSPMAHFDVHFSNLGVVSKSGVASVKGLAGVVPNGSWLPALPNGASVGPIPTQAKQGKAYLHDRYLTLYNTFGPAWRVTNGNSLFDYAPGTSTSNFDYPPGTSTPSNNELWPKENPTSCSIPNVKTAPPISAAAAEEACKLITDASLHSSCVFDVKVTGHSEFADTYLITQRVHAKLIAKPIDIKPVATDIK
jgi:hypothetical protein